MASGSPSPGHFSNRRGGRTRAEFFNMNVYRLAGRRPLVLGLVAAALVCQGGRLAAAEGLPGEKLPVPPIAETLAVDAAANFVGAGSCASSGCHGGNKGYDEPWRSAYSVWITDDKHARAHRVLYGDLAKQIVAHLDAKPLADVRPERDRRCIGCHATGATTDTHDTAWMTDGVSCESCHGPAKQWLATHTFWPAKHERPPKFADEQGMSDTSNPASAAARCAACHVGRPREPGETVDHDMNHDMIAAGHPRLNFEYSTYLALMPKHWSEPKNDPRLADDAQRAQRQTERELKAWSSGQLAVAAAALELTAGRAEAAHAAADPKNAKQPLPIVWPEFSEYDCYRCHHGLRGTDDRQAKALERTLPAKLNFGDHAWSTWGSWPLWQTALQADDAEQLRDLRNRLARPFVDPRDPQALPKLATDARKAAAALRAQADRIALEPLQWDRVKAQLLAELRSSPAAGWDRAAQAYLAGVSLYQARGGPDLPPQTKNEVRTALQEIFDLLKFARNDDPTRNSPREFDDAAVQKQLKASFEKLAAAIDGWEAE
jgi:hypothetical protein